MPALASFVVAGTCLNLPKLQFPFLSSKTTAYLYIHLENVYKLLRMVSSTIIIHSNNCHKLKINSPKMKKTPQIIAWEVQ